MCLMNGTLDEQRARRIAHLLAASARGGGTAVLHHFLRLLKLDCARRTAYVTSAVVLDDRERRAIMGAVSQRYGPSISSVFDVDPNLIGGARIAIGSDVYDGTVLGRLADLTRRF